MKYVNTSKIPAMLFLLQNYTGVFIQWSTEPGSAKGEKNLNRAHGFMDWRHWLLNCAHVLLNCAHGLLTWEYKLRNLCAGTT